MTYRERFSDFERQQDYEDMLMQSMAHSPGGEGAVIAELLSRDHAQAARTEGPMPRFSWRGLLRMPFFGLPSLT